MKRIVTLLLVIFFLTQCSIDRTIQNLSLSEFHTLKAFQNLKSQNQVRISNSTEPGVGLLLCLTFLTKESREPLINEQIKLYHTSSNGEYEPTDPNDESTARLNGTVITDDKGQVYIQTVLPGDYGSSMDNRHIHTRVKNAKPEAYDIHFKQFTGKMGKNFIDGSDQHFLADLKQTKDSILVAFLTIVVKNYENNRASSRKTLPD